MDENTLIKSKSNYTPTEMLPLPPKYHQLSL